MSRVMLHGKLRAETQGQYHLGSFDLCTSHSFCIKASYEREDFWTNVDRITLERDQIQIPFCEDLSLDTFRKMPPKIWKSVHFIS